MDKLNTNSQLTLSEQIQGSILARIQSGNLKPEERLPPDSGIATEYGVSRLTAREAIIGLINKGVLRRVPGKGTFVVDDNISKNSISDEGEKTIAMIVLKLSNSYILDVVRGVEETFGRNGYQLLLSTSNHDPLQERFWLQRIANHPPKGLILTVDSTYSHLNTDLVMSIASKIPTVVMGELIPDLNTDRVYTDDRNGEYQVTKHLIELGHRKIAHLAAADDRLQGYKDALQEFGIEYDPELVRYTRWQFDEGYHEIIKLLMACPDVTAITACNDTVALGILKALSELGISVPERISLAGYGNLYEGAYLAVPLTTVDQRPQEMGSRTASLIMEKLTGQRDMDDISDVKFDARLVIRGSCGIQHSLGNLAQSFTLHGSPETR